MNNHSWMKKEKKFDPVLQAARQRWIRRLINEKFAGNASDFGRAIGKDASYVSRMLSAPEKSGAKNIGEDSMAILTKEFGEAPKDALLIKPSHDQEQADKDEAAQSMVITSLVSALVKTLPAVAPVFSEHLRALASGHRPKPFSTERGLLSEVLGIAEQGRRTSGGASPPSKRRDSGPKSS